MERLPEPCHFDPGFGRESWGSNVNLECERSDGQDRPAEFRHVTRKERATAERVERLIFEMNEKVSWH